MHFTQLFKDLIYDSLFARNNELIEQIEQLIESQRKQRQEISTLTAELEKCKKIEENALAEKQKAETRAEANAQQVCDMNIMNKELKRELRAELRDSQSQEMETKAELAKANDKVFELEVTIKSNELNVQQKPGKQTRDKANTTKLTQANKIKELTEEVDKVNLDYNVLQQSLKDLQMQHQNMKNDNDQSKHETEIAITDRDQYKNELYSLTKNYNDLKHAFSENEGLYLNRINELLRANPKPIAAHKAWNLKNIQKIKTKNQILVNRARDLNKKLKEKTVLADDVQAKLDHDHQSIKTIISHNRVNFDKLQKKVMTIEEEHQVNINKLQKKVMTTEAEHRVDLKDASSNIKALSNNIQKKDGKIGNLKFQYDTIKDNLDHSEKEKGKLRKTIHEFQEKDLGYQSQICTLNTKVQNLSRTLVLTEESLKNEKLINKNIIDLFKKRTETLNKTNIQLTKNNATLQCDILKARYDLEQAERKATEYDHAAARIESPQTELKNLKEVLYKEKQNHKETKDQLENNCKSLTEEKEKLTSEITDLESKLGEMESEMGGLKETATRHTEENAKTRLELEERIRLNNENEKMIKELNTKLDHVENQLDQPIMHAQNINDLTMPFKSDYDIRTQQWKKQSSRPIKKYKATDPRLLERAKADLEMMKTECDSTKTAGGTTAAIESRQEPNNSESSSGKKTVTLIPGNKHELEEGGDAEEPATKKFHK